MAPNSNPANSDAASVKSSTGVSMEISSRRGRLAGASAMSHLTAP
jgi:hypothetical protein